MAHRRTDLGKSAGRLLQALRLATLSALFLVAGCQSEGELANTKNGLGGALAPMSVDDYARQRGISPEQARQELQEKVSKRDAAEAIKNLDDAGTVQQ